MIDECADAGLPGPEFTTTDGFVTTVRRPAVEELESGGAGAARGARLGTGGAKRGSKLATRAKSFSTG